MYAIFLIALNKFILTYEIKLHDYDSVCKNDGLYMGLFFKETSNCVNFDTQVIFRPVGPLYCFELGIFLNCGLWRKVTRYHDILTLFT